MRYSIMSIKNIAKKKKEWKEEYRVPQSMIDTNGFKRREIVRERRPTLPICCLLYEYSMPD